MKYLQLIALIFILFNLVQLQETDGQNQVQTPEAFKQYTQCVQTCRDTRDQAADSIEQDKAFANYLFCYHYRANGTQGLASNEYKKQKVTSTSDDFTNYNHSVCQTVEEYYVESDGQHSSEDYLIEDIVKCDKACGKLLLSSQPLNKEYKDCKETCNVLTSPIPQRGDEDEQAKKPRLWKFQNCQLECQYNEFEYNYKDLTNNQKSIMKDSFDAQETCIKTQDKCKKFREEFRTDDETQNLLNLLNFSLTTDEIKEMNNCFKLCTEGEDGENQQNEFYKSTEQIYKDLVTCSNNCYEWLGASKSSEAYTPEYDYYDTYVKVRSDKPSKYASGFSTILCICQVLIASLLLITL